MQKWEYGKIILSKEYPVTDLDKMGKQGFELVTVTVFNGEYLAWFKLPLKEPVNTKK